jgi:hypothetical protein
MRPILLRGLAGVGLLVALVYAGDYVSVRYGIPKGREPYGSVTVTLTYAIHEKNGKTEYEFPAPQSQACVQSLFPHFGYTPCWYLKRHSQRQIDI